MTPELLWGDLWVTFIRVMGWTILSWLIGGFLGFLAFRSSGFERLSLPFINLMRHISPFCWLPLIIVIAGIGEVSVGLILVLAMVFNAALQTREVLRGISRDVIGQAKLDGADGFGLLYHIELPYSASGLVDILRVLFSVGWTTVIAAEMLGVSSGMGYRLLDFRYLLRYREMLVYIGIIGLVGIIMDHLLLRAKRMLEYQTA